MNKISDKYSIILVCSALALIALAVFWQVRSFEFTNTDDVAYVTKNEHISSGFSWRNIVWVFTSEHVGNWHPLTGLSHMLDCELFGLNPGWHHLVNLFFHLVNILLLFTVLRKITGAIWRSAFVAALFAIHPLHVESVAWISERKDVLSTLFWLLTIAVYFSYVKNPKTMRYVTVIVFFALGLMAKPMLVTLPFVLLLLDYWPLNRLELKNKKQFYLLVREKIPFFVLAAVSCVITFLVQKSAGAVGSMEIFPLPDRIANAVISYLRYIAKMFWPAKINAFYPYPLNFSPLAVFISVVTLLLITGIVIYLGKKYKYLPVGWFWYLGTLVPVIGLVQVGNQAMADRYTYIPLTGLFIIVAWGANDLLYKWKYKKILLGLLSLVIISALSASAFFQASCWRNSTKLFEHALTVTNENYIAHGNLAVTLTEQGKFDEAIKHLQQAIEINPYYADAFYNLGVVFRKIGHTQDEIEAYRKAVELKPDYADAYYNLGVAYSKLGRFQDEIEAYKHAIKIKSDYAPAYNNLGAAYLQLGRFSEAIQALEQAAKIKPDSADAHYNLGTAFYKLGRYNESLSAFKQAVKFKPQDAWTHFSLGLTYLNLNDKNSALGEYEILVKLDPKKASQLLNLIAKH